MSKSFGGFLFRTATRRSGPKTHEYMGYTIEPKHIGVGKPNWEVYKDGKVQALGVETDEDGNVLFVTGTAEFGVLADAKRWIREGCEVHSQTTAEREASWARINETIAARRKELANG